MSGLSKSFSLLIILFLAASSIIVVKLADAQSSSPSPSSIPVPQFTLKFVDSSYDVPTTASIDPYTGQNVTNQGYHVENKTIELIINNQPFTSYVENYPNFFYYNVREKGYFAENWTEIYNPNEDYLLKSNSDYTVVSYSLEGGLPFYKEISSGKIDFQVEALVGGVYRISSQFSSGYEFRGITSGWSSTQTVTIPASTSPTPTPSAPEFSSLAIQFSLIIMVVAGVISILLYRRNKTRVG